MIREELPKIGTIRKPIYTHTLSLQLLYYITFIFIHMQFNLKTFFLITFIIKYEFWIYISTFLFTNGTGYIFYITFCFLFMLLTIRINSASFSRSLIFAVRLMKYIYFIVSIVSRETFI